jgi:hypothetical protein
VIGEGEEEYQTIRGSVLWVLDRWKAEMREEKRRADRERERPIIKKTVVVPSVRPIEREI